MGRIAITTGGVKQSLSNYNALKSICEYIWNGFDAGANRIEITTSRNNLNGISEISIKDNGIGIAKKQLNKKFKPFYESEKAEQSYERTRITGIHGKNGVGRLTFFCFAQYAEWNTIYKENENFKNYSITIDANNLENYKETDENIIYSKKYPFSSKLYCGFCGSLLTRRNWNANRNCSKAVWQCIKRAKHGKEECPYCKSIAEDILEDCFVQGYRILCNDNRKVVENFLEKIENILKENATETMVNKLEKDKEKINKKLANLLELNLEGRINKEQYTEKFDNLNVELFKIEQKIESLLKETNRNESIKQRLNKFKSLFKDIDIMPKFDKDVFECLIDKVVIGEILEDGTIEPYTIRFICKNGIEINCKDKFTATSDKQALNNIAISDKQHMWSV